MERPASNGSCPGCRLEGGPAAGAATGLAAVLIFTIVVDVLGNALVILSVLRNKKLRNAGERQAGAGRVRGAGGAERPRTAPRPGAAPHGPAAGRAGARGGRPEQSRRPAPGRGGQLRRGAPGAMCSGRALRDAGEPEQCPPSPVSGIPARFPARSLPVPSRPVPLLLSSDFSKLLSPRGSRKRRSQLR